VAARRAPPPPRPGAPTQPAPPASVAGDGPTDAPDHGAIAAPAAEPEPRTPTRIFAKGERAPAGLTEPEIADYNAAQGDPHVGAFELAHAFAGDPKLAKSREGALVAVLHTTLGDFECVLFEDETPRTVASFVGLARGTRPWLDEKDGTWKRTPFYVDTPFHRIVAGFVVQTGDRSGTGRGDAGFVLADEPGRGRQHASVGALAMANRGKNTAGSQFYVTLAAAPHLDGMFTVFGECDADVPLAIGRVHVDPKTSRPKKPVLLKSIDIVRKAMPGRATDVGPPLPPKR
jgi:peptidyl-prolyl cis-trans isomerase A (cyclophilin A)